MRKLLIILGLVVTLGVGTVMFADSYSLARADFTGRSWTVKTATGQIARKCEYRYQSRLYYEIFPSFCPAYIEIY